MVCFYTYRTVSMTTGGGSTEVCDVVADVGSAQATDTDAYTYDTSLTPTVTSVDPIRGGTGGGTSVTISGTGFGCVSC